MPTGRKKRRLFLLPVLLLPLLPLGPSREKRACAQAPEDGSANSAVMVRPCAVRPTGAKPYRKNKTKGKAAANPSEIPLACVEAKDSPLNIQEFFQSYVRVQAWRFAEEEIVADGWIFARALDKDELLQFAKEGRLAGHVTWSEGKAIIRVSTRELDGGYTRVEVSVHLQGFGQNVDRFAPARDTWDLDSTGLLEKTLIEALEDHFKSLHSTPSS
ncbi:MAG: hypothetical protein DMG41_12830 [Acidobacteria bacterium]|nr:MAG: hypothetical protein AUH13_20030 [Acidobacteria bacterium 13_2_20CM_58_27]PYT88223.1 MAG: hypothetical protein DMG41_12830 [Acidobacteriota bacterium]